ncbi:MAG: hypothetical protein GXP60_07135 [Epsilonproteobacteria bacterium]|nr:hypothetical protein [Campylobacterota bacterium]
MLKALKAKKTLERNKIKQLSRFIKSKVLVINLDEPFRSLSDEISIKFVDNFDKVESLEDIEIIYVGISRTNSLDDCKNTITNIKERCGYLNIPVLAAGNEASMFILKQAISFGATSILILPVNKKELIKNIEKNVKPAGKRISLNVSMVNPFISATKEVFEVMSGIHVKRKSLFLKKDYKIFGEISGIMGLTGDAAGSIAISFSYDLAKKVISVILDMEVAELEENDVKDGIGEILNMIAGQTKAILADTKYRFKLSIPAVVAGYGYEIYHPENAPCIVVIFEALDMQFALQVSLTPSDRKR